MIGSTAELIELHARARAGDHQARARIMAIEFAALADAWTDEQWTTIHPRRIDRMWAARSAESLRDQLEAVELRALYARPESWDELNEWFGRALGAIPAVELHADLRLLDAIDKAGQLMARELAARGWERDPVRISQHVRRTAKRLVQSLRATWAALGAKLAKNVSAVEAVLEIHARPRRTQSERAPRGLRQAQLRLLAAAGRPRSAKALDKALERAR